MRRCRLQQCYCSHRLRGDTLHHNYVMIMLKRTPLHRGASCSTSCCRRCPGYGAITARLRREFDRRTWRVGVILPLFFVLSIHVTWRNIVASWNFRGVRVGRRHGRCTFSSYWLFKSRFSEREELKIGHVERANSGRVGREGESQKERWGVKRTRGGIMRRTIHETLPSVTRSC
jgi:hypothetical protein